MLPPIPRTPSAPGERLRRAGSRWCPPRSATPWPPGTCARRGSPCCTRTRH